MVNPETKAPWDFSNKDEQNKVEKMVTEGKPFMLISSPPCTAFSQLQGLSEQAQKGPGSGQEGA